MKVEFITDCDLRVVDDGGWLVIAPFVFEIDGHRWTVPAGYWTDMDSVPRLPLAYWLVKGRARKSAVMHDWLYGSRFTRKWADDAMFAGMETERVKAWARYAIWAGVRLGGWSAYGRKGKRFLKPTVLE